MLFGGNVFGDHAAGADNGVFTDGDVGQNGAPGTDRRTLLHHGPLDLPVRFGLQLASPVVARGIGVVDERDAVADEDVVFDGHAFADEGVAGDLAAFADGGILLDLDKGADLGFVANLASVEIDELAKASHPCPASRRRDASSRYPCVYSC